MSHVLILGGDGYLGWPTAMYFSARGYEVTVVDNYFRRHVCDELNVGMLYPVPTLVERARIWYKKTGYEIKVIIGDLTNPELMRSLFTGKDLNYQWSINKKFTGSPETVVHYAEQPSAPYSLMNYKTANFTLSNNLIVTNNLMFAVKDLSPDTHIIKLGTMGEYGTPNIDIEEGWIDIKHKGREDRFLFPRQSGSIYHTSKIMDTDLMWFGCRMWDLKVTDLMQGPVYGIETNESIIDDRLKTIFNYDELFGTVINRFVAQATIGYPLSVYGKGEQIRGYINIKDTLQCVHAAEKNTPKAGELNIYNQIMETFTVNQLAILIQEAAHNVGHDVRIEKVKNPRIEEEEHYYNPNYQGLTKLGVIPHYLTIDSAEQMIETVSKYRKHIDINAIRRDIHW
jgi:UDP-sulfoquinovose synthase